MTTNTNVQDFFDTNYIEVYPNQATEGDLWEDADLEREGIARDSKSLWTVVDIDGDLYIVAGWHYVNRMGYMVTTTEWNSDTEEYIW